MASIVKRRGRFCVVYLYTDAKGNRKQKWETYKTQAEAKARQKEIEYKEQIGTFVIPQCRTLDDLLKEYVALYGKNTWAWTSKYFETKRTTCSDIRSFFFFSCVQAHHSAFFAKSNICLWYDGENGNQRIKVCRDEGKSTSVY